MNVLVVEPGIIPYETTIKGLSEMQSVVDGHIRVIYPFGEQVAVICNVKAPLLHLPFNRSIPGKYGGIFGTFFICRCGENGFCSLTRNQIKHYRAQFYEAELLLRMDKGTPVTLLLPPRPKSRVVQKEKSSGHEGR